MATGCPKRASRTSALPDIEGAIASNTLARHIDCVPHRSHDIRRSRNVLQMDFDRPSTTTSPDAPTQPSAVADENIRAVAQLQQRAARQRTLGQRVTDALASFAARESAIALHAALFAAWITVNLGVGPFPPFDPYPFTLLVTVVSLEAIFLSLFVLASQTRLTQEADRRAHLDLQVNLLSEQEMTLVLQMLKEVCEHLGLRETIQSKKFLELAARTDVGQLAKHLEQNIGIEASPTQQPEP